MVADVHRTLLDGGIFMYPADMTDPGQAEAEAAAPLRGGADGASWPSRRAAARARAPERVLDLAAKEYHQRAAILVGSPDDVALAEEFYRR